MARKESSANKFSLIDGLEFKLNADQSASDKGSELEPKAEPKKIQQEDKLTEETPLANESKDEDPIVSINLRVPLKLREALRLHYAQTGERMNVYIRRLIEADLKK